MNPADVVTLGTGYSRSTMASVDVGGNVFVADASNNRVMEIPLGYNNPTGAGNAVNVGTTSQPQGVAVDLFGNLACDRSYVGRW